MKATYLKHLVSVEDGKGHGNYLIVCSCGYREHVASLSDVFAASAALRHVVDANTEEKIMMVDADTE